MYAELRTVCMYYGTYRNHHINFVDPNDAQIHTQVLVPCMYGTHALLHMYWRCTTTYCRWYLVQIWILLLDHRGHLVQPQRWPASATWNITRAISVLPVQLHFQASFQQGEDLPANPEGYSSPNAFWTCAMNPICESFSHIIQYKIVCYVCTW